MTAYYKYWRRVSASMDGLMYIVILLCCMFGAVSPIGENRDSSLCEAMIPEKAMIDDSSPIPQETDAPFKISYRKVLTQKKKNTINGKYIHTSHILAPSMVNTYTYISYLHE